MLRAYPSKPTTPRSGIEKLIGRFRILDSGEIANPTDPARISPSLGNFLMFAILCDHTIDLRRDAFSSPAHLGVGCSNGRVQSLALAVPGLSRKERAVAAATSDRKRGSAADYR